MLTKTPIKLSSVAVDQLDIFDTDLGWIAAAWNEGRLFRLRFGFSDRDSLLSELPLTEWDAHPDFSGQTQFARRMREYAEGRFDEFRDLAIVEDVYTPFQLAVVRCCRLIPYGETKTYGEIAQQAGAEGAARAVGTVMSQNRLPLVVPCHRVIGCTGSLNGFSAPGGLDTKQRLLALEGADPSAIESLRS